MSRPHFFHKMINHGNFYTGTTYMLQLQLQQYIMVTFMWIPWNCFIFFKCPYLHTFDINPWWLSYKLSRCFMVWSLRIHESSHWHWRDIIPWRLFTFLSLFFSGCQCQVKPEQSGLVWLSEVASVKQTNKNVAKLNCGNITDIRHIAVGGLITLLIYW